MLHIKRSPDDPLLTRHHGISKRFIAAAAVPAPDATASNSNEHPVAVNTAPDIVAAETHPNDPVKTVASVLPVVSTPISTPPTTPTPRPAVPSHDASRPIPPTSSHTTFHTTAPKASASAHPTPRNSGGLSSGAMGGIVTVVLLAVLVAIAFFVRKGYQHRRALKRNTWCAGLMPSLDYRRQSSYTNTQQNARIPHHNIVSPPSEMSQTHAPRVLTVPPALASASAANYPEPYIPPTLSPQSPITPFVPPSIPAPSLRSLAGDSKPTSTGELAIVVRTFIPTLPDELHIANGEQICILSAYDDGWALCANIRGEQGVVPLECLERRGDIQVEMQLQPDSGIESNRTSRRMSSLTPIAPGTY